MATFFRKKPDKKCIWCEHGVKSEYTEDVFCKKQGVVKQDDACRKFKYDPLKRSPGIQTVSKDFTAEDFSL